MEYSEDQIAIAAEYALGTLDAEERADVEIMMSANQEFAGIVQAWEFRLGVLNQMVGSVEPPPELWERIRIAVSLHEGRAPIVLPEPPPSIAPPPMMDEFLPIDVPAPMVETSEPAVATVPAAIDDSNVIQLSRRVRSYRNIAAAMTAIAAALLAVIGVEAISPGLLPGLGGKPRTEVAEVKPTPAPTPTQAAALAPSAQYVALLQGSAGGPAFILTVDGATKEFTVRKVGAPPIDAGKSYELWLISDKLQNRPRSLGVIGTNNFTARRLLASYDADVVNNATYAVTVEQAGGSPDGAPHSQPAFIGKLIQTVPPPSAAPSPSPTQNR